MSSKSDIAKKAAVIAKRFTLDKVINFQHKAIRNLPELLSLYPNYGLGFKVFLKHDANKTYYFIDKVNPLNNRHADFYGIKYTKNGVEGNKNERIRNTLKKGIWNFTVTPGKCVTENGMEYDIKNIEDLVDKKKQFLESREKALGLVSKLRLAREEEKKNKLESDSATVAAKYNK